jgi:phosphohistidine phosphatase SixA
MRQLLLLRHAKSSWDDPSLPDHARPLNARGRRAAQAMAAAMRDLGLSPDVVLVSSARRTLQTLEAVSPFADSPLVEPMDDLYLAPWPRLLDTLRRVPETARSVMLIGHNPGLHDLALALIGGAGMAGGRPHARRIAEGFPTCALAEFASHRPGTTWPRAGGGWCASWSRRTCRRRCSSHVRSGGPRRPPDPRAGGGGGPGAARDGEPPPAIALDFELPAEAARLTRLPALRPLRHGRGRTASADRTWFDTADGRLAAQGLILEAPARGPRRLLRILPRRPRPGIPASRPSRAPSRRRKRCRRRGGAARRHRRLHRPGACDPPRLARGRGGGDADRAGCAAWPRNGPRRC